MTCEWRAVLLACLAAGATCGSGGCPPPRPPTGKCDVELKGIKSVLLSPQGTVQLKSGGSAQTISLRVLADAAQQANASYCFGVLAGNSPLTRATDYRLGGFVLLGNGAGVFESGFQARCSAAGLVEVFLADEAGTLRWTTTKTHDNNIYALTLPAGAFSPASNVVDLKCN